MFSGLLFFRADVGHGLCRHRRTCAYQRRTRPTAPAEIGQGSRRLPWRGLLSACVSRARTRASKYRIFRTSSSWPAPAGSGPSPSTILEPSGRSPGPPCRTRRHLPTHPKRSTSHQLTCVTHSASSPFPGTAGGRSWSRSSVPGTACRAPGAWSGRRRARQSTCTLSGSRHALRLSSSGSLDTGTISSSSAEFGRYGWSQSSVALQTGQRSYMALSLALSFLLALPLAYRGLAPRRDMALTPPHESESRGLRRATERSEGSCYPLRGTCSESTLYTRNAHYARDSGRFGWHMPTSNDVVGG